MNKKSETVSSFSQKRKIMRKVGAICLSAFLTTSVFAQVTVNVKQQTIKQALRTIEKVSDYRFFYSNQLPDLDKKVTFEVNNQSIEATMSKLLSDTGLVYEKKEDNQIYLGVKGSKSGQKENKKITGTIVDDKGEPVIGANVSIKGTTTGSITDINGNFSLDAMSGATLLISYIGYAIKEIPVGNQSVYKIVLAEATQDLDEVVVVGYMTQRKGSLTGSVVSMNVSEELRAMPTTAVGNILAGKLPGVSVSTTRGIPGSSPDISIRTGSSWNDQPVTYVIDGVVRDGGVFNELSPNEIENITVLKDAASAAIYGSRSAGGVILVSTRRGSESKPVFNYSYSYGVDTRTKNVSLTSAVEMGELYNRIRGDSDAEYWTQEEFDHMKTINNGWGYDQLDYVWKNPNTQTHNFSVTGGSKKVKYFAGASYVKQEGFLKPLTYDKYNIRFNVTVDLTDNLQFFAGMGLSNYNKNKALPEGADGLYAKLLRWQPWQPIYTDSGKSIDYDWMANIGASLNGEGGYSKERILRPQSVFNLTYKLPFIDGMSVKAAYGQNWNNTQYITFQKRYEVFAMKRTGGGGRRIFHTDDASIESSRYTNQIGKDYLEKEVKWSDDYQLNLQVNYDKIFNEKHKVQGALVFEKSEDNSASVKGGRETFPVYLTDQFWAASGARADTWGGGDASKKNGRISYIGQFNYSYADKYLLNFSFREDGSMRFAKDQRWGFFPAASAGWVISEESFFKKSVVDYLKMRMSIGLVGNDNVGGWQWQESYKSGSTAYYGETASPSVGIKYGSVVNPNLTWEKSLSYNVGADMNFLSHWNVSAEYWFRKTYDILGARNASVPTSFSLSMPDENYGQVNAQGLDFNIGYRNGNGKLDYHANLTLSYGWNKVIIQDYAENAKWIDVPVGKSRSNVKGYRVDKIICTQAELDQFNEEHPGYRIGGQSPELGMLVYKDLSGPDGKPDGIIDSWDKDILWGHNFPIIYGLNLGGNWKGFSLDLMFNGKLKEQKSFKNLAEGVEWNRMWTEWYTNSWTPETPDNWLPRRKPNGDAKTYLEDSDFWYKDASFIRLKYVTLGYTIPQKLYGKCFDRIKLFFTGTNLFTLSNFSYYDPEMGNGVDYPVMRSFNFGVDVTF